MLGLVITFPEDPSNNPPKSNLPQTDSRKLGVGGIMVLKAKC